MLLLLEAHCVLCEVQTVSACNVDYSCIAKRSFAFLELLWTTINDNEISLSLKLGNVICGPRDTPYLTSNH
jgi:hypothetical protein